MAARERDSQRNRVYKAEDKLRDSGTDEKLTLGDSAVLVREVTQSDWFKAASKVMQDDQDFRIHKFTWRMLNANATRTLASVRWHPVKGLPRTQPGDVRHVCPTMNLNRYGNHRSTILHELAHLLAGPFAAHGERFVAAHLFITNKVLGVEATKLLITLYHRERVYVSESAIRKLSMAA